MDLATSLLNCLCGCDNPQSDHPHNHSYTVINEKPPIEPLPALNHHIPPPDNELDNLATQVLTILLHSPSPSPDADLTSLIANEVSTKDWTSYLAERVLHAIEDTLKGDRSTWGEAINDAYTYAVEVARAELDGLWEYAKEHPYEVAASVLLTVLALGVLARLVPAFVRVLGFGRAGPIEGEYRNHCFLVRCVVL